MLKSRNTHIYKMLTCYKELYLVTRSCCMAGGEFPDRRNHPGSTSETYRPTPVIDKDIMA